MIELIAKKTEKSERKNSDRYQICRHIPAVVVLDHAAVFFTLI